MGRAFTKAKDRFELKDGTCKTYQATIKTRRKPLRKSQLTAVIIKSIIFSIESEKLSHQEVGIKYNVRPSLVSRLKKVYRKRPEFVEGLQLKEEKRSTKLSITVSTINSILEEKHNLWNTEQVV